MNRIKYFSFILGVLSLLTLTACQTGGGYSSSQPWEYKPTQSRPAQKAPATLRNSENTNANANSVNQESQTTPEPQENQRPEVKVAILLPLSGQHEKLGKAMLNAAQLAMFDTAHENFKLMPYDTQGKAESARKAASNVINKGADLILGPVFAQSVQAVKPIAQRANINVIAFSNNWNIAGGNTFVMGFLPFDQIERLARYTAQRNIGEVSILSPRNDYGTVVTSAWQATTSRLGVPPAKVTDFSLNDPNLAPMMRKFTNYDERIRLADEAEVNPLDIAPPFNAILMPVGGQTALSISNLLSHYNLPPKLVKRLGTGLMDDEGLASEESLEGTWFAAPSPKLRKNFEKRYISTYSESAPRLASLAYDATALAAVLANRSTNIKGQADFSIAAIRNPNGFSGVDGIFRFRPNGTAERGLAILEFNRGRIRTIDDAPRTFQNFGY